MLRSAYVQVGWPLKSPTYLVSENFILMPKSCVTVG